MSLRFRLYLVGAFVIVVLMIPAILSVSRLVELRQIAFDLKTRHAVAFLAVGRLETSLAELHRIQRSYVSLPGPAAREAMYEELVNAEGELGRLRLSGYGDAARAPGAVVDSLRAATERLDSMVRNGRLREATALFNRVEPLHHRVRTSLTELAETIDRRSTAEAVRAERISSTMARTTGLAYGLGLFVAVLVGTLAVGGYTSLLERLREAMARVAAGRFVPPENLPYDRKDEVGDLSRSFRAMTERLAELDRLKAEFVSVASHELKTPISVIEGYAEMLEDGLYGPVTREQVRTLRYVQEQADALAERVGQLLSLSRLEARGPELSPREVDPRSLVEGVRRSFEPVAAQRGVRLLVEVEETTPAAIEADAERVRNELLGNLISNALKFTPSGGRIVVRAQGTHGGVEIVVSDTGDGIPSAQLPYVFEKYYQAGSHAGKVGTGLGLAIAREVAEAHRGSIEVESVQGEGTTFRVFLPLRLETGDGVRPGPPREPSPEPGRHRADDGGVAVRSGGGERVGAGG